MTSSNRQPISPDGKEVHLENQGDKGDSFFVRIAGRQNDTLFVNVPALGASFDYSCLERHALYDQWVDLKSGDDEYVVEVRSVRLPDGSILQVGKSTEERERFLERLRAVFVGVMIPAILLGLGGGGFISFRALSPIRSLVNTVRSIDTRRMDARVPESHTGDELEELVFLFNGMLEKIQSLINGMQDSLDNVAHDLRTPITRLRSVAEVALQLDERPDTLREALMDCAEESERLLTMVNTLMDISEAETGVMRLDVEEINFSALIADVVDLYEYVAQDRDVCVCTDCPEGLYLRADPNRMRQVIANLLDNAIKYTPGGGRVEISACRREEAVMIIVRDTGEGIPPEELPRIWDRLYRVDKSRSRRGLGLGLSLVKAVIHAHRGSVEASSEPGKGSVFILRLPATS